MATDHRARTVASARRAACGSVLDFEAIAMLWQRDLVRFARERTQLYGSLARTVVWLFILGAGLRGSVRVPGNISYLAVRLPRHDGDGDHLLVAAERDQHHLRPRVRLPQGDPRRADPALVDRDRQGAGRRDDLDACSARSIFIFAPFAGVTLQPAHDPRRRSA